LKITELVVDTAATIRLTRLVLDDTITEPLRDAAMQALIKTGEENPHLRPVTDKLEYLLTCPWCVSVYSALLVFALRRVSPQTADIVSAALAASLATGVVYPRITD
jgi:hypothetical protein